MGGHGSSGARIRLGGFATVHCVHDREKRVVTDPEHVRYLGHVLGITYDPKVYKLQSCACCGNLHVTATDTPVLCETCRQAPAHAVRAPIPAPLEESF